MVNEKIEVAHLSDTHLGFTQYSARTPSGRPAREQDFARAFINTVDHINDYDPPLVIHSGDFYDKAYVSLRQQKQGQEGLKRLAVRKDGTTRVVVVISGNHDQPADPREPAALELNEPINGVHIVTSEYKIIDCRPLVEKGQASVELENVVIHALPHDQLREVNFDDVRPLVGRVNILTTHGVVGGSDLYKTTKGREFAVPADVLGRGWHYVALGHWHKRGPVPVAGMTVTDSVAWYAGSNENNGFGDVADNDCTVGRGYLQVKVENNPVADTPVVRGVDLPVRAMFTLPEINAEGKTADEIETILLENLENFDVTGAVVRQKVINVTTDVWVLVNVDKVRGQTRKAVWYQLSPIYAKNETTNVVHSGKSSLLTTLSTVVEELYAKDEMKSDVEKLATGLLTEALDAVKEPDDD